MNLLELSKAIGRIAAARSIGLNLSAFARGHSDSKLRILLVANALIPTLQISFIKPLTGLIDDGDVAVELLSEQQMRERFGKQLESGKALLWIEKRFQRFRPTIVVFCRYNGPNAEPIVKLCRTAAIPVLFHLDDDLLCVPPEIGQRKYQHHNQPARLATIHYLLAHSDVVYCSTEALKRRLLTYKDENRFIVGDIYCSGEVLAPAKQQPARKIGYMGFDHAQDFTLALPALINTLRAFPHITFDLFGAIPKPLALNEFGKRVRVIPPIKGYDKFMQKFASLNWDIGICPLAKSAFNNAKANTKWIEYTSIGAAVIASRGTVYDDCCAEGRGLLVEGDSEWERALHTLITMDSDRVAMVRRAQKQMTAAYSAEALTRQTLGAIQRADLLSSTTVTPSTTTVTISATTT